MRLSHLISLSLALALPSLGAGCRSAESSPAPATEARPPRPVPPDAAVADVALLRTTLERLHPGYTRYATPAELAAAWARLDSVAASGPTDLVLFGEVSRLLAVLRCDHTKAELPVAVEMWRDEHPTHLPFRFRLFDGRMYVDTAFASTGLARGDEILALDGSPVGPLLDSLAQFVSIDGFTEHVRVTKLEGDGDLYGTDVDTYLPVLHGLRERFELVVRRETGTSRPVTVDAVTFHQWKTLTPGAWRQDFGTATSLQFLDDTTALLRIPTFVNYRKPVKEKAFVDSLFRDIAAHGTTHLILDIGGGGSTEPVDELLRHVISEPMVITREARVRANGVPPDIRPHVTTWNKEYLDPPGGMLVAADSGWWRLRPVMDQARKPLTPYRNHFAGRVTILTGPGNASGSTMLIARLHAAGRVRLVGDSTGGSAEGPTAGTLLTLTLPGSGVQVRVPLVRSWTDAGSFVPGKGVPPDVLVIPTRTDWLAGRDVVLEAARE